MPDVPQETRSAATTEELREEILSKPVTAIAFGSKQPSWETEVEIVEGSITVSFNDGSAAIFTAVWHNDSTAGLYMEVVEL